MARHTTSPTPPTGRTTSSSAAADRVLIEVPRQYATVFLPVDDEFGHLVSGAVIELREDGSAGLQQVEFLRPLGPRELRTIPWQRIIDETLKQAIAEAITGNRWTTDAEALRTATTGARAARQNRRRLTPELLRDVATIYDADGAEAVAQTLCVSPRQASRYVAKAREEGYLS